MRRVDEVKPKHERHVSARVIKMQHPDELDLPEYRLAPIKKSDSPTQLEPEDVYASGDIINHPYDMRGLQELVDESTILPQCIEAYSKNIAGFGISVRYIDDTGGHETPEMISEFDALTDIIDLLTIKQDTKEVFEDIITSRETFGIAYLECIRDLEGNVVEIEFVRDTPTVWKTKQLAPYIDVPFFHKGKKIMRRRKFCKYIQQIGGKTVYFKEFGDPRVMDRRTGRYLDDNETIEFDCQANEIMEFTLGQRTYGCPRWAGQILGVDGSRRAETLNNNYFRNGRHTPLLISITGGSLTDESYAKLQNYMDSIRGEAGQHSFLLLETQSDDARTDFDQAQQPKIEVKDIANILQKDGLFLQYKDDNRKSVQSAFRLPDIYVAYTTDYNRATAQAAQELTEQQVFQPERQSIAWAINNILLNCYDLKYCEVYFEAPKISNPDDLVSVINAANAAGGITPNKAKDIAYRYLGETAEPYPSDWGDVPIVIQQMQSSAASPALLGMAQTAGNDQAEESTGGDDNAQETDPNEDDLSDAADGLDDQIIKAQRNGDDDVVGVMREVRKQLQRMQDALKEGTACG